MRLKRRSPSVNLAKDAMASTTAGSPFSHRACGPNGRGGKAALDSGQENDRGVFRGERPALRALHGLRHALLQAPDMCASGGGASFLSSSECIHSAAHPLWPGNPPKGVPLDVSRRFRGLIDATKPWVHAHTLTSE